MRNQVPRLHWANPVQDVCQAQAALGTHTLKPDTRTNSPNRFSLMAKPGSALPLRRGPGSLRTVAGERLVRQWFEGGSQNATRVDKLSAVDRRAALHRR
jgi:hypothetical protein